MIGFVISSLTVAAEKGKHECYGFHPFRPPRRAKWMGHGAFMGWLGRAKQF
ncbi:MAG: hypothetical protein ABSF16_07800 [Terracidiphilus sp.]|jgi:hypothetical protein